MVNTKKDFEKRGSKYLWEKKYNQNTTLMPKKLIAFLFLRYDIILVSGMQYNDLIFVYIMKWSPK